MVTPTLPPGLGNCPAFLPPKVPHLSPASKKKKIFEARGLRMPSYEAEAAAGDCCSLGNTVFLQPGRPPTHL